MSSNQDDELMVKLAQGCSKSFETLFNLYGSLILGYATKLLKNKASAEDISQEVWVKIAKAAPNYQPQGQFKAWAFTLTRNLCFNKMKSDQRLQFYEDVTQLAEANDTSETIETKYFNDKKVEEVSSLLDSLPDNQRISLLLVAIEGMSYEEVAEHMSISIGATKSLIHRARKTLNEKFGKETA